MIPLVAGAILLASPPGAGLCVAADGKWFVGAKGGISVLTLQNDGLKPAGFLAGKYSNELDLYRVGDKLIIVDYSLDFVECRELGGRTRWRSKLRSANMTDIDEQGVIWSIAEGGIVFRKTAESSEFEPLLNSYGEEVTLPKALDIAPMPPGLYVLDENGKISVSGKRVATVENAQRILPSKGGVIAFVAGGGKQSIVFVAASGTTKTLWTAPQELGTVTHFSRIAPGRVLVAGPKESGGFAMIVALGEKF